MRFFKKYSVYQKLLIAFARYKLCESEHGNDVRNDHKLIERVGKLPYEVVGKERAYKDKDECDYGIYEIGLLTEEVVHVDTSEKVPTDYRGEREEEQTDRNEAVTDSITENAGERKLCHIGLRNAVRYARFKHI